MQADPDLLIGWLRARSIARGLPAPVADAGGWRVDTRSDAEWSRHVFAAPSPGLERLARRIDRPRRFLKLCAEGAVLGALLPARWTVEAPSWMMTARDVAVQYSLPPGYRAAIEESDGAIHVRISSPDGAPAAGGHAAEHAGIFVYDRIVTAPDHRRRGLGAAVMAALGSRRRSARSRPMLVATAEGRALYAALGWDVHAPYASAVIPDARP